MPDAVVATVEAHRVDAVEPLHAIREVGLRPLDEQVEVVVEQTPGVDPPAVPPLNLDEQLEPRLAVEVVEHDPPLLDAAADHVVPGRAR
jgi:hypothetical protein